jgi:hypothetical protein
MISSNYSRKEVNLLARLLLALIFIALLSSSAGAESIWVEAEAYTASFDAGGLAIYITGCSGASGGMAVEGFDYPGDWIELKLTVGESGAFVDSLRSGGLLNAESDIRATIYGAGTVGDDLVSDFHTYGYGVG